jgi:hypothetical protein
MLGEGASAVAAYQIHFSSVFPMLGNLLAQGRRPICAVNVDAIAADTVVLLV